MTKYRILGGTPDADGTVELPDGVRIIGAMYHPITGELNVVMLQEVPGEPLKPKATGKESPPEVIHLPATNPVKETKAAEEKPATT